MINATTHLVHTNMCTRPIAAKMAREEVAVAKEAKVKDDLLPEEQKKSFEWTLELLLLKAKAKVYVNKPKVA